MGNSPSDGTLEPVDIDGLFRRYHAELSRFAYRRVRNTETAADIVQDAFLRYIDNSVSALAERLQPRFFLWRIVSNLTIDLARRERRSGPTSALDDVTETLADPRPTPYQSLESREQLQQLKRALSDLSPPDRAALLLSRIEGLSHAQIAERMGVSPSMVSKYIMSALRHCLRRMAIAGF